MNNELSRDTSYLATEEDKDIRIDAFLAKHETNLTRSRIQTLIKEGNVKINGLPVKASYRLKTGDGINEEVEHFRLKDQKELYQFLSSTDDEDLSKKLEDLEQFYNFDRSHGSYIGKTRHEVLNCELKN